VRLPNANLSWSVDFLDSGRECQVWELGFGSSGQTDSQGEFHFGYNSRLDASEAADYDLTISLSAQYHQWRLYKQFLVPMATSSTQAPADSLEFDFSLSLEDSIGRLKNMR